MSRRWLLFPFCLSLLLVLVPLSSGHVTLSINESATRVLFEPEATMVVLSMANPFNKLVAAHIRLVTRFDKTEGRIGDAINCHVEAEGIGRRGYGMMLAEIGLPPAPTWIAPRWTGHEGFRMGHQPVRHFA